jgi:hypothetical protein
MAFVPPLGRTLLFGGENGGPPLAGAFTYGPVNPASATPFGSGCGSGLGLGALDLAWLGDTCRLTAGGLQPGTNGAFFALGLSATTWGGVVLPFDLTVHGLPGCSLHVAADATAFVLAPASGAVYAFGVPATTALLGAHVFAQALAADPAVAPGGFGLSPALDLVVGSR